jgi:RNA polymerase sigma-70 factor, ECF subfamily
MSCDAATAVARLAREDARRLTAAILRVVGAARLDFAEDCVQDALAAALKTWPERGVPGDPFAWVLTTARNRALDRFRRNAAAAALEPRIVEWVEALSAPAIACTGDEELAMLAMCCHEALEEEARIALTLKSVCGFTVPEIARAFLVKPETLAQRLVRAKTRIRDLAIDFGVPGPAAMRMRMPSVLKAIYLLFNEGYAPSDGDEGLRAEICAEAWRLIRVVTDDPRTAGPEGWALRALICFQRSRERARINADGTLILLPDQDRKLWDRALIVEGFRALQAAMTGERVTAFHAEAGIASVHAAAPAYAATDWSTMIAQYDALITMTASPVAELNRAVAVSMRDGAAAGLEALMPLEGRLAMIAYAPFHIVHADLAMRLGRMDDARASLARALALPLSTPERRLIEARVAALHP